MADYYTKSASKPNQEIGKRSKCDKERHHFIKKTNHNDINGKPKVTIPHKKRRTILIVVLACFIILIVAVIWVRYAGNDSSLTMTADKTDFLINTPETVNFTVTVPKDSKGEVSIIDENNNTVAVTDASTADDNNRVVIQASIESTNYCVKNYAAALGMKSSNKITVYITPEITDAMVDTLIRTDNDLNSYLQEQGFTDKYTTETLDIAEQWLKKDNRINKVVREDDQIFYNTTDGLMGHCVVTGDENTFGSGFQDSGDAINLFKDYQDNQKLDKKYLDSEFTITNGNVLVLNPLPDDFNCHTVENNFRETATNIIGVTKGTITEERDLEVLRALCNKSINNYGFILINTHGGYVAKENLYYLELASKDKTDAAMQILRESDNISLLYGDPDQLKNLKGYLDTSNGLCGSQNLIMDLYQNEKFDNSIIFNGSCYGANNSKLSDFFTSHGAMAYLGFKGSINGGVQAIHLKKLFGFLTTEGENNQNFSLGEAFLKLNTKFDLWYKTCRFVESIYGSIDSIFTNGCLSDQILYCSARNPDFYVDGKGSIKGQLQATISDGSNSDFSKVNIECYRWINKDFKKEADMTADHDGHFTSEMIPRGIYVIVITRPDNTKIQRWLNLDNSMVDGGQIIIDMENTGQDQESVTNQTLSPQISTDTNTSGNGERDIVLVLDTSGSMDGEPLYQTKQAAVSFIDTVLQENVSIGIVTYDTYAHIDSDFSASQSSLESTVENLSAGEMTNMDDALSNAAWMLEQSNASKKIIVLMSDGQPNTGLTGNDLIAHADTIKNEGISIYTLGFFQNLYYKYEPQSLLQSIASSGYHYEVDDTSDLTDFFNDIADQINGQKFMYVRVACPVDVSVTSDGETLESSGNNQSSRSSFGTLTYEENQNEYSGNSSDNRIKVLRLRDDRKYDIQINGNGSGNMDYTIGFMDDNGDYSDLRDFSNISIEPETSIRTAAKSSGATYMDVDENGDGRIDVTYKAGVNETAQVVDYSWIWFLCLGAAGIAVLIILIRQLIRIDK